MIWFIVFVILTCLGFWWDTARQNRKIKDLLKDYLKGEACGLNDLHKQIERWVDAQ